MEECRLGTQQGLVLLVLVLLIIQNLLRRFWLWFGGFDGGQYLVGHLHRHTTKVRYKVGTVSVAHDTTLGTFSDVLTTPRQDVPTVATPFGTSIQHRLESMWDTVVQLGFIWVNIVVGFRNTFRDHLLVAFFVAQELTVLALEPGVSQELSTQCTAHDIVELFLDKLMAQLFEDFLFLLTDGPVTAQGSHEILVSCLGGLFKVHADQDLPDRFQDQPRRDQDLFSGVAI